MNIEGIMTVLPVLRIGAIRKAVAILFTVLLFAVAPVANAQFNDPPGADAGPDTSGVQGATVRLDGSGSYDPEFAPMSYQWTQLTGPTASVTGEQTAYLDVLIPVVGGSGGSLIFQLTVTDEAGQTASDTAAVTVLPNPPTPGQVYTGDAVFPETSNTYFWGAIVINGQQYSLYCTDTTNTRFAEMVVTLDPAAITFNVESTITTSGAILIGYPPVLTPGDYSAYCGTGSSSSQPVDFEVVELTATGVSGRNSLSTLSVDLLFSADQSQLSGSAIQGGETGSANLTLSTPNQRPVADAGTDQAIRAGDTVFLDGSASYDDNTDSALLQYAWSFLSLPVGSTATIELANTATPYFIADVADSFAVQLIVTDGAGQSSDPDYVDISSDNLPPTAAAGNDQLVVVGTSVLLDGSGSSDPESDPLGYSWSLSAVPAGSVATLIGPDGSMPSLTPDVQGDYEATLVVSDPLGPGAPDSVTITAASAQDYADVQIVAANTTIANLAPAQITNVGNQHALTIWLGQTTKMSQRGNTAQAIAKLQQSIARTDGCALRGSPDTNGPGRDWVTDCASQATIYAQLTAALDALMQ